MNSIEMNIQDFKSIQENINLSIQLITNSKLGIENKTALLTNLQNVNKLLVKNDNCKKNETILIPTLADNSTPSETNNVGGESLNSLEQKFIELKSYCENMFETYGKNKNNTSIILPPTEINNTSPNLSSNIINEIQPIPTPKLFPTKIIKSKTKPLIKPLFGTATTSPNSQLKLATPRPPPKKAIFISRCDPETKVDDINNHISSLNLPFEKTVQLKTKLPNYSSFCIICSPDSYENIFNPEIWPKGILVMPYFSRSLTTIDEQKVDINMIPINDSLATANPTISA
jgi:hypothetical protein